MGHPMSIVRRGLDRIHMQARQLAAERKQPFLNLGVTGPAVRLTNLQVMQVLPDNSAGFPSLSARRETWVATPSPKSSGAP